MSRSPGGCARADDGAGVHTTVCRRVDRGHLCGGRQLLSPAIAQSLGDLPKLQPEVLKKLPGMHVLSCTLKKRQIQKACGVKSRLQKKKN